MSASVDTIVTMLNEEKWTRTTIANFTLNNFQEQDALLASLDAEDRAEVKRICDEHLGNTRNSITALYMSGIIAIERHSLDDANLLQLVEVFEENKKWNIVEFLCQKILSHNESRYALRALSECYQATGRESLTFEVWERLVKVDYDEIQLVTALAEHYAATGDMARSGFFYKKAMLRYINSDNFNAVQSLWTKFLEIIGDEFGYLMGIVDRVALKMGVTRAIKLLSDLYQTCDDDNDRRIDVLSRILQLDGADVMAREALVACYRQKYKDHSRLEDCISKSGLLQNYRDVHTAIEVFEKNIAFDKGTFVFHKTWGIGRIRSIGNDKVIIDFAAKPGHEMGMAMAFGSLQVLPKTHIWVLKSAVPHDKLAAKFKGDIPWSLRTLISSNGNTATFKEMKAEVVPSILTPSEWTAWTSAAKKELMANPLFDISPSDADRFIVRTTPISYEEKQLNIFKTEKNFYDKIRILREFMAGKGDMESDSFFEMVKYFNDRLGSTDVVDDVTVSSFLIINELRNGKYRLSFITPSREVTFADLYAQLPSKVETFKAIKDSELNKEFIDGVIEADKDGWEPVLRSLFPHYLTNYIPEAFKNYAKPKVYLQILKDSVDSYKEDPDTFLFLVRSTLPKQWAKAGISSEKLLLTELQLLDYTFRCIESGKNISENRKNNKLLLSILFDDKTLYKYIDAGDEANASKVFSLIKDMQGLDPSLMVAVKHQIFSRYPHMSKDEERPDPNATFIPKGLLCTQASLDAKRRELDYIMNVELPEVAKEIGIAREMGDLRENSEYKYGKEKQGLLSTQMRKLSEEMDKAQVIAPDAIDSSKIGFGTKVTLLNNLTGKEIVYSIMGPWESDPNNNIISFQAPLGRNMLNHVVGDAIKFNINDQEYDFVVRDISPLAW